MQGKDTVLVTGASGLIGKDLIDAIKATHHVRTFSRRPVPGYEGVQADINDLPALNRAMQGVATVVHLAAALPGAADDGELMSVNVTGTYNLFEQARRNGVRRVVLASTGAISGGYFQEPEIQQIIAGKRGFIENPGLMITELDPPRPTGLYAVTKLWGEALGRYHSEANGISVICIRLGRVIASDEPEDELRRSIHLSRRDATQVLVKSIEAPASVRFACFYASSNNPNRWRDNETAKAAVGYEPLDRERDSAPAYARCCPAPDPWPSPPA